MDSNGTFHVLTGWLIDGTGGPIQRQAVLEISRGIIISIKGPESRYMKAKDTIDLSHCTLLPGLVDSHVHLSISGEQDQEIRQRQLDVVVSQQNESMQGAHRQTAPVEKTVQSQRQRRRQGRPQNAAALHQSPQYAAGQ